MAIQGLFAAARAEFERLRAELSAYGLVVDGATELREGHGLLCYYDLRDGHIYLSLPTTETPLGVFQAAIFRNLLGCADDAELEEMIRRHLPWLMAHELGHYFRHRTGRFGADLWHEEQIANQFAAALIEHRLSTTDRERWIWLLQRAVTNLAPRVGAPQAGVASFYDPLHSLGAAGMLRRSAVRSLTRLRELTALPVEEILRGLPVLPPEILTALDQRQPTIDVFNSDYTASLANYVYLQYSWLLLELQSPDHQYIDALAQAHLGASAPLLQPPALRPASDAQIAACRYAAAEIADRSPTLGRYFARRHRALLLARVQAEPDALPAGVDLRSLVELEGEDALDILWIIAPPSLRHLIADPPADPPIDLASALPDPTDARLYALAPPPGTPPPDDPAAANTLQRLAQLETSPIFRDLSVEQLLELTRHVYRVHLPAGEVLIQQGSENDDVFLLVSGALEVVRERDGALTRIGTVQPGEVVGELAFLSGGRRAVTVRATEAAELMVIRAASLYLHACAHPAILFRMGRALAERLARTPRHPP